jgi:Ca2+-binding EF-hand superfamily protein
LIKIKLRDIENFSLVKELDMKHAFNLIDVERTGYICAAQLIELFSTFEEGLSPEQAAEMITVIPTEVFGRVNFKEFCELMNSI